MSRLVAFGCSYTYGHGLADCHIPPNLPGKFASNLAWPSLLANQLNVDVVNCSNPGASNIQILWKLLNFKFEINDICTVLWSHFGRSPFSKLEYDSSLIKWSEYDKSVIRVLPNLDQNNIVIRNYISIHHAYLFLQTNSIPHRFMIGPSDAFVYMQPDIEIPTLIKKSFRDFSCDKALDLSHPGPITHEKIAKEFYNNITIGKTL